MTPSAIVLCGGGSTRMGRDKALLPFGDETMLARVVRLVGEVTNEVVVVARAGQPTGGAQVVHDPIAGLGPLAGLVSGLKTITGDRAFVTACDQPLLRPALVQRLIDLAGDHDVCVPVEGDHAMVLCAVYRTRVIGEAERLLASGERRLRHLLETVNVKRVDAAELRDVDPELESFFSCDTPEKYQQALQMARRKGGPYIKTS